MVVGDGVFSFFLVFSPLLFSLSSFFIFLVVKGVLFGGLFFSSCLSLSSFTMHDRDTYLMIFLVDTFLPTTDCFGELGYRGYGWCKLLGAVMMTTYQ